MNTQKTSKINQLWTTQPSGVVFVASWLTRQGYSLELQRQYRKSGWLETVSHGAMKRVGEKVDYTGAVYALQQQLGSFVHPGGRTALALLGKSHYLELVGTTAILFGPAQEALPRWLVNYKWNVKLKYYPSSFLPADLALVEVEMKNYSIKVSSPVRALLECLYLVPRAQDLQECRELMMGLNNVRPALVQQLLEECRSIKVKRLFLYLADQAGHEWLRYLDVAKIDLGKGKRQIYKDGIYSSKYQITVPKELENNVTPNL